MSAIQNRQPWSVHCLCAEWCEVCRGFRAIFDEVRVQFPGIEFRWIDIEDDSGDLDDADLDIEDFPTIRVLEGDAVRFLGPIRARAAELSKLLNEVGAGAASHSD